MDYQQTKSNKKAVFLGSKKLGLEIFRLLHEISSGIEWLVIHPNDISDVRSYEAFFLTYCQEKKINFQSVNKVSEAKALVEIFGPTIGFVSGWYWLLDNEFLSYFNSGLWGLHNSLLPKYRGCSPLVWSVINGDNEVGATLFKISDGIDNGDIAHQFKVTISNEDNIATILHKIESIVMSQLPSIWPRLIDNNMTLIQQDSSKASYCCQRTPQDGLIEWNKNAREVHNFIRAQSAPYAFAFSYLNGNKISLYDSTVIEGTYFGIPGQIIRKSKEEIIVSCGCNSAISVSGFLQNGAEINSSSLIKSIKDRFSNQ